MKNKFVKLICLLLCLALALSAIAGCKGKNTGKKTKKNTKKNASVSSELASSTSSDEWIDDEPDDSFEKEEPIDEDPIEVDPEGAEVAVANVKNAAPLTKNVMGAGMGLYIPTTLMDADLGFASDEDVANAEFDRLKYIGVHTVRSMFKLSWVVGKGPGGSENWESDKMQALYKWMQGMKDRNIDVLLNPWYFGSCLGTTKWDTSYHFADTTEKTVENWTNLMTKAYLTLYAKGFNNVNGLVLFTEPNYAADLEKDPTLNDKYIYVAKKVDAKFRQNGIRQKIRIIGPNYPSQNTVLLDKCVAEAPECFEVLSSHRYGKLPKHGDLATDLMPDVVTSEYEFIRGHLETFNKQGKQFWLDEYGVNSGGNGYGVSDHGEDNDYFGIQYTAFYNCISNIGGITGASIWTIADQKWEDNIGNSPKDGFYYGVLRHGFLPDLRTTLVPKRQYYAISLYMKYTGGRSGNTVYTAETENLGVTVSARQLADGNWTFIVTNMNVEDTFFKLNLEKALGGIKLYRHQYVVGKITPTNAGKIIPANKTIKNVKTGFTDVLEPYSVSVYTTVKG